MLKDQMTDLQFYNFPNTNNDLLLLIQLISICVSPGCCLLCVPVNYTNTSIYDMFLYAPFFVVQSIYEKYLANPPKIATEAIPMVLCSEQPSESQKKSLGKSKWWHIVKIIYD